MSGPRSWAADTPAYAEQRSTKDEPTTMQVVARSSTLDASQGRRPRSWLETITSA